LPPVLTPLSPFPPPRRPQVAKIQYALKITFIFVALLFVDAVQRLVRVSQEAQANKDAQGPATDLRTETAVHSRKVRPCRRQEPTVKPGDC
jgi:hypothetical protein